ncbi:ABSCISIC ACID-INSENSITIVE 5-like protein 2 [Linum perenne]
MGSHGDAGSNGNQSLFQPLGRQNSLYNLTLDEVQNQLGDLGKPLISMNLDELLKNVLTAEANQSVDAETEGTQLVNQTSLQRQASLSIAGALSKKTVDEVWRDIQQSKTNGEKKKDRQPTLGEMTLEDFLVKAGVVAEASMDSRDAGVAGIDANVAPQFSQQTPIPPPQLMGTLSDSQMPARKRGAPGEIVEKHVERRQKRMIKNRESAARSRARKQVRFCLLNVS